MKKLWNLLVLLLAIHFLLLAGAVGWLYQTGRLDRSKVLAIREVLFPKPAPEAAPATQPSEATTRPTLKLEELLAQHAGRPVTEQVAFLQRAFDAQMAVLDRRQRELNDLQRQVELAKGQMTRDRAALDAQAKKLAERQQQATTLAADKGFQDSLERYQVMPAKQVKEIFMQLDETTVVNYLRAMEPRAAGKILKEFKSPEELARAERVLEMMRQAGTGKAAGTSPAGKTGANTGANLAGSATSLQPPGGAVR